MSSTSTPRRVSIFMSRHVGFGIQHRLARAHAADLQPVAGTGIAVWRLRPCEDRGAGARTRAILRRNAPAVP
jgi:hypothetical protein